MAAAAFLQCVEHTSQLLAWHRDMREFITLRSCKSKSVDAAEMHPVDSSYTTRISTDNISDAGVKKSFSAIWTFWNVYICWKLNAKQNTRRLSANKH